MNRGDSRLRKSDSFPLGQGCSITVLILYSWGFHRLAARNAALARKAERKANLTADKRAFDEERLSERRQKEASTMDM